MIKNAYQGHILALLVGKDINPNLMEFVLTLIVQLRITLPALNAKKTTNWSIIIA